MACAEHVLVFVFFIVCFTACKIVLFFSVQKGAPVVVLRALFVTLPVCVLLPGYILLKQMGEHKWASSTAAADASESEG